VTLFEELQIPYETQFVEFGSGPNGVEGEELKKRTLTTVDQELQGKQYLVGGRCTIADLAFVNWDIYDARGQRGGRNIGAQGEEIPQLDSLAQTVYGATSGPEDGRDTDESQCSVISAGYSSQVDALS